MDKEEITNSEAMGSPQVSHEDILAFIQGWDLVRRDDIITINPLEDEEELEEEIEDE